MVGAGRETWRNVVGENFSWDSEFGVSSDVSHPYWFVCHSHRFYCLDPEVDNETQAVLGCTKDKTVKVPCFAAPNVTCSDVPYNGSQCIFEEERPCRYV